MKIFQNILFVAIGGLIMHAAMVIDTYPKEATAQIILGVIFFVGVSRIFKEEV